MDNIFSELIKKLKENESDLDFLKKCKETFLKELLDRCLEAVKQRPDVSPENLIVPMFGDSKAESIEDINARGEESIFVCMRCEDSQLNLIVNGSGFKRCAACNNLVWMSPATELTMSKLLKTRIVCTRCWAEKINDEDSVQS